MAISIENVSLSLGGSKILDDFSLALPERGLVCLSGPSGCGKTTLLRLLCGLIQPQRGFVRGLDSQGTGVVFQEDRLLPWLSAAQNVALVQAQGPVQGPLEWLALVELEGQAEKLPHQLSGGMRRRVAIARALAYQGRNLLLDEPTNGLDEDLSERLISRIKQLYREGLILMITHDQDFAARHGDMLIRLSGPPLRKE